MQFLNPNISGEMAQLLQHNQEKYVPCLSNGNNKTILEQVSLHGDQLFEERARNVIWTYRDGVNEYERLQGMDTEFADWHAKYTLYKVIIAWLVCKWGNSHKFMKLVLEVKGSVNCHSLC